jgi:ribulose-phosphate 3-epimerase
VLNPETKLERAESYFNLIDVVQFMTVNPGQQGAPFVPEVLGKIKRFTALKKRPLCAVDGGVNKNTITELKSAGVEIFNVGSAIMKAEDVEKVIKELSNL